MPSRVERGRKLIFCGMNDAIAKRPERRRANEREREEVERRRREDFEVRNCLDNYRNHPQRSPRGCLAIMKPERCSNGREVSRARVDFQSRYTFPETRLGNCIPVLCSNRKYCGSCTYSCRAVPSSFVVAFPGLCLASSLPITVFSRKLETGSRLRSKNCIFVPLFTWTRTSPSSTTFRIPLTYRLAVIKKKFWPTWVTRSSIDYRAKGIQEGKRGRGVSTVALARYYAESNGRIFVREWREDSLRWSEVKFTSFFF